MFAGTRRLAPVIAALSCSALAFAAEPTNEELKAQIDTLQKKVDALEAKQVSSADVDATVQRVLEDAQKRSQMMSDEGFTAGYTKGKFVIQSADGNFLLHPYLQFQFRYVANDRVDSKPSGGDDVETGFEVRRMKFGFDGNVFSPEVTYQFQWATDRGEIGSTSTGEPVLEDAWVKYQYATDWAVQGGQFKDPLFRESLVSSMKQLAAERSLLSFILEGNDNYVEGASLIYTRDRLHIQGAFTNGFSSQNTTFVQPVGDPSDGAGYVPAGNRKYDYGVAGRAEYMVLGDPASVWKQYSQFTALDAKDDMLILGAAGEWDGVGDANVYWYTLDAQWLPAAIKGLSIYGAYAGRYAHVDNTAPGVDNSANDWGALAQAGYLLDSGLEPFARVDYTYAGADIGSDAAAAAYGTRNIWEITAGVNYYLHGQAAKFTVDLTYLPNGSPVSDSGADILSQAHDNAQWLARVQFQLML